MSDAIEAAAKALISAQRDMFPGGGWFALDDAKTLVIAALTAYEAAKGGGVAWRYFTRRHMPGHHDSGGEVVVPFSNDDEMAAIHAALTSPASGERDAVIEAEAFDDWWSRDGQYLDPDTADVPWFDKRRGLAEYAYHAGVSSAMWPDFIAPPKYENPAPEWNDPKLPDFRLIWQIAHDNGYAIGLHGSMRRDCDLIAVPWVEAHSTPEALISALCSGLNAREVGIREPKPNGRLAVNIQIDGWFKLIDLSVLVAALMEGK